jgi:hypothetical protein
MIESMTNTSTTDDSNPLAVWPMLKSEWLLIGILFYVTVFPTCVVTALQDARRNNKQTIGKPVDTAYFEKVCREIPRQERLKDAWVLISGRLPPSE